MMRSAGVCAEIVATLLAGFLAMRLTAASLNEKKPARYDGLQLNPQGPTARWLCVL